MSVTATSLVKLIDAVGVNLNTKTLDEMEPFVEQVRRYGYKAAIGPLCYIPTLARRLADTDTLVSAPIGVPGGIEDASEMKAFAAKHCVSVGCKEVDINLNLMYLRSGRADLALKDLQMVREAVPFTPIQVVIESPQLTDEQIRTACGIVLDAGCEFVKTCTGAFGKVTVGQVRLIAQTVKGRCAIKAAGGVDTLEMVDQMVDLGVTRFGMGYVKAGKMVETLREQGRI